MRQLTIPLKPQAQWKPQTFEELSLYWVLFYANTFKSASSIERDKGVLRIYLLPVFGKTLLEDLSTQLIEMWFAALVQSNKICLKTCNDILGLLRKIMNDAYRWSFVRENPVARVRKVRVPEQDFDFWSNEEVKKFLAFFDNQENKPRMYSIALLALYTGMRRGEILALKWDAVDFTTNFISVKRSYCKVKKAVIEETKSKKIRRIPLHSNLKLYLQGLAKNNSFVFSYMHPDSVYKEFKKMCIQSETRSIRFHDLRHTFASSFLMGGGNIYDLKKILGHSSIQVTERYTHLVPDHLKGKTEVLGF